MQCERGGSGLERLGANLRDHERDFISLSGGHNRPQFQAKWTKALNTLRSLFDDPFQTFSCAQRPGTPPLFLTLLFV